MGIKLGIDVGGTFTDFLLVDGDQSKVHKTLSTPKDPSEGLMRGIGELAEERGLSLEEFVKEVDTIVHGTTVTTNATLTLKGAKTGLLTTHGLRDALEMRRGIREEQYNNWYLNAPPLVPRKRRVGVRGRLDYAGKEIEPLEIEDVKAGIARFQQAGCEAVAICFMNAFANREHEREAARLVREAMPDAYLTVSTELLPAIRFYERLSTTVLNSYVGPLLDQYFARLTERLAGVGFAGVLLIMQSNGGVIAPDVARRQAVVTVLSGPAAGPAAGIHYASVHGREDCITIDMGGTSFDAAMVLEGVPVTATEGSINRYRVAMPMLDIVTIGAGGGSIGWIDEGGLLRMGPDSAGADPGPVCYGQGGERPSCTDADLILGYLNPGFFAGGRIQLDLEAAEKAIEKQIGESLGLDAKQAAAGMYRVINTNMANGVREVSIRRGHDPREFMMVVAGGAGPMHACMICKELEITAFVVPKESSIFCAAGMLMSDLKHDFVRSSIARMDRIKPSRLQKLLGDLEGRGRKLLASENIPPDRIECLPLLDMRYVEQYHEVTLPITWENVLNEQLDQIALRFHAEHNRLYGYSLEKEGTPLELINVRIQAVGRTEKPEIHKEAFSGTDAADAMKGERPAYIPEDDAFRDVTVFDGDKLKYGNRIVGPALIEQVNTTTFVSGSFDAVCDEFGSFVVYEKGAEKSMLRKMKKQGVSS